MKVHIKMEKIILKFGDTEIEKQKFTTRSLSLKTVSNISLATKMLRKFHPFVYFFQNWVYIAEL